MLNVSLVTPLILVNTLSKWPMNYQKSLELQVRHKWEAGDVAMWDNFGTAHYGVTADLA